MKVIKRDGREEPYCVEKIHKVVTWAVDGISGVSLSDIELNAGLQIEDGITTKEIHEVLIKSAADLISEETPNYQWVAARLLSYSLRKDVWGESEAPRLLEHIKEMVDKGIYDGCILEKYSNSELNKLGKYIKHSRDEKFTYSGLQQMVDKYLIKNRNTGQIFETPQFAYMLIPIYLFSEYPAENRTEYIKKAYDYLSLFKINLPTPIMAGVRSTIRQFASCCLFDVADDLDSIFANVHAIGRYTARRAGIGINVGRIRSINSPIRGGEVQHTGLIPYLKVFESTVKSCSQNGLRGGSATCAIQFFHYEIEDVVVLKNNGGTDDNRVRKLDYSIQFSRLFYERFINNEDITLFSPHECQALYEKFGTDEFDEEYRKCEKNTRLQFRKKIKARKLGETFARERLETGRIYCMNIDHANKHSPWKLPVKMSQLCQEIIQPTKPIYSIDDKDGEIGICVLSAVNLLETKDEEMEDVCEIIVRLLDELIDYQDYPVEAAEKFTKRRRSLGVGLTNLAGFFAKNKTSYEDPKAVELAHRKMEQIQFYLLSASCKVSAEKGPCEGFSDTKYSDGLLPTDWYNKNVDNIIPHSESMDWEGLRSKIKKHGLRHSTVSAQMPAESSSVIQNSTNGPEPVRRLLSVKKAKNGMLKQLVPHYSKYKNYYTKAFDIKSNECLYNIAAAMQKWIDMGISLNSYYNYSHYENENIPSSQIMEDVLYAYQVGLKTLYYANSDDGDVDQTLGCESGACAI